MVFTPRQTSQGIGVCAGFIFVLVVVTKKPPVVKLRARRDLTCVSVFGDARFESEKLTSSVGFALIPTWLTLSV